MVSEIGFRAFVSVTGEFLQDSGLNVGMNLYFFMQSS